MAYQQQPGPPGYSPYAQQQQQQQPGYPPQQQGYPQPQQGYQPGPGYAPQAQQQTSNNVVVVNSQPSAVSVFVCGECFYCVSVVYVWGRALCSCACVLKQA